MKTFGHCGVLVVIVLAVLGAVLAERKPKNECKGKVREGKPCNNGTGVCRRVPDGPGERKGLLQCVATSPITSPLTTSTTASPTTATTTTATTSPTMTTSTNTTTAPTNITGFQCLDYPPPARPVAILIAPGQEENGVYEKFAYERYSFEAPVGQQVKVTMAECEIEGDPCFFDFIRLEDGLNPETDVCGYCSCFEYITAGRTLQFTFISDAYGEFAGFTAYISYGKFNSTE